MKAALIIQIAVFTLLFSCSKGERMPIEIGQFELSDCKSFYKSDAIDEVVDTLSCIDYTYDSSTQLLLIKHINAAFNCCPGQVSCTVERVGDTIIINEEESQSICDCNCLYDFNFMVENVEKETFILKIEEPYWTGAGGIEFEISLKKASEGRFCVVRKGYPWGNR